jgi:hypothetical protein
MVPAIFTDHGTKELAIISGYGLSLAIAPGALLASRPADFVIQLFL